MFITLKRQRGGKPAPPEVHPRLTDAILTFSDQGLFLLDGMGRIMAPVSHALATLFPRTDFANLSFDSLLTPVVSAKTLTLVRAHTAALLGGAPVAAALSAALRNIEVRLPDAAGSADGAHYWFDFDPVDGSGGTKAWLVRVTDITLQVQTLREVEELRSQGNAQMEMLRGVLRMGRARVAGFIMTADASLKAIAAVLKKSAREQQAFRSKLEETLGEVGQIRREAATLELTALERAARVFEDALHELRARTTLSGGDFLPLAVLLTDMYTQFALLKSLALSAAPLRDVERTGAVEAAPLAGSLESTLQSLTTHIAELEKKQVLLDSAGLRLVPARYQSVVKNVAIQLIRNAIMHGIEAPSRRAAVGKALHGTLRLNCRRQGDTFELLFEDDGCGLDPQQVRATAVQRGLITPDDAAGMRDREAIKLIFKSRFTTLDDAHARHGAGMSLVRRHVHECGGKIALASLPGRETRFKITLPLPAEETRVA